MGRPRVFAHPGRPGPLSGELGTPAAVRGGGYALRMGEQAPSRKKRVVRVELDPDVLEALADEAEDRSTTAPLLIAMLMRERVGAP